MRSKLAFVHTILQKRSPCPLPSSALRIAVAMSRLATVSAQQQASLHRRRCDISMSIAIIKPAFSARSGEHIKGARSCSNCQRRWRLRLPEILQAIIPWRALGKVSVCNGPSPNSILHSRLALSLDCPNAPVHGALRNGIGQIKVLNWF